METKVCTKCKEEKELNQFNFVSKIKDIRQSSCKTCQSISKKKCYENNKSYYLDKVKEYKNNVREVYKEIKSKLKCSECEESHTACIEFHHKDGDKQYNVSSIGLKGLSVNKLLKEIEKCIVLCSNCHRKLHYNERQLNHN